MSDDSEIERELTAELAPLLSTCIAILMEDAHEAMVRTPPPGPELMAHAERMRRLGRDVAALGQAMEVIARRSAP